MKNKITKTLSVFVAIVAVLFLGFSPVAQNLLLLKWGDLGVKMVEAGVIDEEKFAKLYHSKDEVEMMQAMLGGHMRKVEITEKNSRMMLNMLWGFGLSNKNRILEEGPMMDPRYGGPDRFASTGGWTLGEGSPMDHYSMHDFVKLTEAEQKLVEKVAKNVFRPCCKNSTYFPDCNHGMAMLGLLTLAASEGAGEDDLYGLAERANTLWFPKIQTNCGA